MNRLHNAYFILGLQPGSRLNDVIERYKELARVWHPDRAGTPEQRMYAEEEMKKINNAKDLLKEHLTSKTHNHFGACECNQSDPSFGENPPKDSSPKSSDPSEEMEESAKEWRIYHLKKQAIVIAAFVVTFVLITIAAWPDGKETTTSGTNPETTSEYSNPRVPVPAGPTIGAIERERREHDIYFCNLSIDRHQQAIKRDRDSINEIEIQLLHPLLSGSEKDKLLELKTFRLADMQKEIVDLKLAQQELAELQSKVLNANVVSTQNDMGNQFAAPAPPPSPQ
jgi:curved DNA-binding protein CbpA